MPKKKHQKEQPLDLALVIGLTELIKQLANYPSLDLEFAELAVIERYETGTRRQAIQHIRANVPPKKLGFRKPRKEEPERRPNIGELFIAGKQCPVCHEGVLSNRVRCGKKQTACSECKFFTQEMPIVRRKNPQHRFIAKFLSDLRKNQIHSAWHGLNDPDPPRF